MARSEIDGRQRTLTRVVAAILHDTHRVLMVQQADDDTWRPPVGNVERGESAVDAARRHVRRATGFEVVASGAVDRYPVDHRKLVVVRCRVQGIGSDIAPEIRALRWLTPSDVLAEPAVEWTAGLLAALGADSSASATTTFPEKRVALTG